MLLKLWLRVAYFTDNIPESVRYNSISMELFKQI
jgi:hypothetical protein